MNALRPEDRNKAVILVGLVFAVFALAGWRAKSEFAGPSGPAAVADQKTAPVTVEMGNPRPVAKESTKPIEITLPAKTSMEDPFRKIAPETKSVVRTPKLDSGNEPMNPMKGDIVAVPSTNPTSTSATVPISTPAVATPPLEIEVKGVITGTNGVAILKVGEKEFAAKVGATFNGSYKVRSVSETEVIVAHNKTTMSLSVNVG